MHEPSSPKKGLPIRLAATSILVVAALVFVSLALLNTIPATSAQADGPVFLPNVLSRMATPTPSNSPIQAALTPYACCFATDAITGIAHAGDQRLFVLQREGIVRVVDGAGQLLATPFLDISDQVTTVSWDAGLLGIAFDPAYALNGYFYITATPSDEVALALFRFQVMNGDPDRADPDSGVRLMTVAKPTHLHNGGDLHFGPDGYLYIALGDGSPDRWDPTAVPGDVYNHGQRLDEALGNILRIDVSSGQGSAPDLCTNGSGYTVPADNPFVDGPGGDCDEVWAYGLRNPWRFSFDKQTGDVYIADVGDFEREEVNYAPAGTGAGANYGWHCWEGTLDYQTVWPGVAADCVGKTMADFVFPVLEAEHAAGSCSVIGGFAYRGGALPDLFGQYVYGDYCTRQIQEASAASGWQPRLLAETEFFMSTFGQDLAGELYVGGWNNNTIWKLVPHNTGN